MRPGLSLAGQRAAIAWLDGMAAVPHYIHVDGHVINMFEPFPEVAVEWPPDPPVDPDQVRQAVRQAVQQVVVVNDLRAMLRGRVHIHSADPFGWDVVCSSADDRTH